jgi:hypothetical protein
MYLARFSYDVLPINRRRAIDLIRREVEAACQAGLSGRLLVPLTRGHGRAAVRGRADHPRSARPVPPESGPLGLGDRQLFACGHPVELLHFLQTGRANRSARPGCANHRMRDPE